MSNLYTGKINTNGEYQNLATLTDITFTQDTVYAIQIQNMAWLREGLTGKGFVFDLNKGFNWTCKGDDLYIKTENQPVIVNIAENSGFFLNKSSGGATINNEALIQRDNVERDVESIINTQADYTYNFTNVGGVTINYTTNVASGFSTTKYLILPKNFNPQSNSWEVVYKIKTGSDINTNQFISGSTTTNYDPLGIIINDGKFKISIYCGQTQVTDTGTYSLSTNTIYWVRTKFDGTKYTLEYSTDGLNYTLDISINSTLTVESQNVALGIQSYSAEILQDLPFLGSIYLAESYININGQRWWIGAEISN